MRGASGIPRRRKSLSNWFDGTGQYDIHTGIGFFDHMLEGFAKHGLFDLAVSVQGDTHVDAHHTVEDTGIVLGQAFLKALGDKKGIAVLVILYCRWTMHWCLLLLIFRDACILPMTLS